MSSEKTTSGKAASDFRLFLKDTIRKEVDFSLTDQSRGFEAPAIEKPYVPDARRIDLPKPGAWQIPAFHQAFCGSSSVVFVWTALPYRTEWRYGPASYKVIAIDAGHVCQNLYLACEAIEAGTCAVAAYDQEAMDHLFRLDGDQEFTIYLAPVGKVKSS